ncbi:tRNA (adenosine(37)-N6)-threonylcarbamoyltransferase complex dimerization subunit type 1 TsaB [Virgibacillus halodenitrificans]|uniref:tRNA (adenosine(37)-N6)-threonylcarbamoyltransferase complex dimerization subunit type 1 TsaB n=1 Tax=Virgibacillus halodenitrificans TaxID=1482 RepID=UPI000EF53499|nr:tRNA (adenosine(37)-N6)-threonylcarbamoyltransferase complex dimerization subunit type 1 TsaB [Virgibacillus halodenitrificans]
MSILAIDTSNQALGVAILNEEKIIGEFTTNIAKNHSLRLMPAIEQLMKEVNVEPQALEKIIVAKGPGSYTGVRIGLATAKTMAWALDIPVVGVSSLKVLAHQGRFFQGYICPFFDARRGLVYAGLYQWKNGEIQQVWDEVNIPITDLLSKLADENKEILFLSPDIEIHRENIISLIGGRAVIPEMAYHISRASHIALAGLNENPQSTHALTPNYLRLAEAEAKWLNQQKEKEENG